MNKQENLLAILNEECDETTDINASVAVGFYAIKSVNNEQHKETCQLTESLQKQKTPIPEKILQYFEVKHQYDIIIDPAGIVERLNNYGYQHNCLSKIIEDDYPNSVEYEIDISQLPPGTKKIKIIAEISW